MAKRPIDNCLGKSVYETFEDAKETADYLFYSEDIDLEPYKCPICQQYHLTRRSKC